jgi:hypothetical protein
MDESSFEAFAARVQDANDPAELDAAAAALAPLFPRDGSVASGKTSRQDLAPARELALNMSTLKKRGDWVDARSYSLAGRMSTIVFDFLEYRDSPDFFLAFDIDLSMSTLKIVVPEDWQVDIRLSRNSASTVKDRGPAPGRRGGRITVDGSVSMSTLVVKRRREGRGGLLSRLFYRLFGS